MTGNLVVIKDVLSVWQEIRSIVLWSHTCNIYSFILWMTVPTVQKTGFFKFVNWIPLVVSTKSYFHKSYHLAIRQQSQCNFALNLLLYPCHIDSFWKFLGHWVNCFAVKLTAFELNICKYFSKSWYSFNWQSYCNKRYAVSMTEKQINSAMKPVIFTD